MGAAMKAMKKVMKTATKAGMKKRVMKQQSLGKTITVKGHKYDKEMILAARRATRGGKNNLVSMNDAKQIFEAARPGSSNTYDAIEKKTMAYIRKTMGHKFTPQADALLRSLVAKAAGAQAKRTKAKKAMKAKK